MAIFEAGGAPLAEYLGTALNNLAQVRWALGDFQQAHDLFWRAFESLRVALGEDHPQVTSIRGNYGTLLKDAGHYEAAVRELKSCVASSTARLGAENPATARYLARYADALFYVHDMEGSARAYEQAVKALAAAMGPDHPRIAEYRQELAITYALLGDQRRARTEMRAALDGVNRTVRPLLDVTSERERLALIRSMRENLDMHLSLLDETADVPGNYAAMLGWKGAVRNSLARQRAALLSGDDPALMARLDELDRVRTELAGLVFGAGDGKESAVRALTADKERLEKELARSSDVFRERQGERAVSPRDLCRSLAPNEVLVDFLRHERILRGPDGRPDDVVESYLAMVSLGGACSSPRRVELGEAQLGLIGGLQEGGAYAHPFFWAAFVVSGR